MSEQKQPDQSRRDFLTKGATAAAGLSIAPGVLLFGAVNARPADQAVTDQVRWGMLVDTNKCANGCDACVTACKKENGWGEQSGDESHSNELQKSQWIRKVELRHKQTGFAHSLPMMCQHCEHPPCADVCPTGASFKRADGIVLVDKHICIGCRFCMMACPYKARSFVHEELTHQRPNAPRGKGTVEACTMCVGRVDAGLRPACVESCPSQAILFGDLKDPNSEISKTVAKYASTAIRPDLGLNPGVRYQGI